MFTYPAAAPGTSAPLSAYSFGNEGVGVIRSVGLVTADASLVQRAEAEAERRGVRLRVAGPDDGQTLGDLVWGCELVIVGRDARDDETTQRVLRSARDLLEMA